MQEDNNQEETTIKSKRGGARAGAGRRPSDNPKSVRASFSFTRLAADKLQAAADAAGVSRNDFLNSLLEAL